MNEDEKIDNVESKEITRTFKMPPKRKPIVSEDKIPRNAPCPCGSGKKFKKCHEPRFKQEEADHFIFTRSEIKEFYKKHKLTIGDRVYGIRSDIGIPKEGGIIVKVTLPDMVTIDDIEGPIGIRVVTEVTTTDPGWE